MAAQFMSKIIEGLQTTMDSVATKSDATVTKINDLITALNNKGDAQITAIGNTGADQITEFGTLQTKTDSMITKLDSVVAKLQGVIDSQYSGDLYIVASNELQYSDASIKTTEVYEDILIWEYKIVAEGSMRVSVECTNEIPVYNTGMDVRICLNDVEMAHNNTLQGMVYQLLETDLNVVKNDIISITIKGNDGKTTYAKNIKVQYTIADIGAGFTL